MKKEEKVRPIPAAAGTGLAVRVERKKAGKDEAVDVREQRAFDVRGNRPRPEGSGRTAGGGNRREIFVVKIRKVLESGPRPVRQ